MKQLFALAVFVFSYFIVPAQGIENYQSLDPQHPIYFGGNYIVYNTDTIHLNSNNFFVDARLDEAVTKKYPYVFNSVNAAATQLHNGTEAAPMHVYIAPYVYWIDNPDDTAVQVGENGQPPFGLVIKCEWLKFYGLTDKPENVVLACNRGQTIGAKGNFTMFRFYGNGTAAENITFGNYCNVDLAYPLLPALNRNKRATAIVQAQLIICDGDKIVARNTRFISRLNLCPFVGGKRVLFDGCHFESTDDALCGTGVYLNCTLDFYSSKPFYRTNGTGAVFLNCSISSFVKGEQYFTKANGQLAVVDTKFKTPAGTYLGWRDVVPHETKNYQYGNTQNGNPVFIGTHNAASTIDLKDKNLLNAYRFAHKEKMLYNTYNLLQGNDDWDPMHIKNDVQQAEKILKLQLTQLPVQLLVSSTSAVIETNKNETILTARLMRFGNYETTQGKINWQVAKGYDSLVKLVPAKDGFSCRVIPVNNFNDAREVIIIASTKEGLQGAAVIAVSPTVLPAPDVAAPYLTLTSNGQLQLNYKLKTSYADQSVINWYRCTGAAGSNAVEVAVSRFNEPLKNYTLTTGDAGYYLMAAIQPKHQRSALGNVVKVQLAEPISITAVKTKLNILVTDFKNISTRNQPLVLPGFFTWHHLEQVATDRRFDVDTTKNAWYYGTGSEGAAGITGVLQGRNAMMRYTPVGKQFGDMQLSLLASPFKSAGQGFSVAPLYMDILIKMDNNTMNGYGLRLIRTTKYHDAVDVYFVEYTNGVAKQIGEAVSTTVFKTVCSITVGVKGNKIWAKLKSTAAQDAATRPGVLPTVDIATDILSNNFGGIGIEFRGGSPVVFSQLKAEWE